MTKHDKYAGSLAATLAAGVFALALLLGTGPQPAPLTPSIPPEPPAVALAIEVTATPSPEPTAEPTPAATPEPVATRAPAAVQTPTAPRQRPQPAPTQAAAAVVDAGTVTAARVTPASTHVVAAIHAYFPASPGTALRVATCESGLNPAATGAAGERGIMQIHPVHAAPGGTIARLGYTWGQMYEVGPNLAVAAALVASSGWGPWACA